MYLVNALLLIINPILLLKIQPIHPEGARKEDRNELLT